jgi:hypothetical protein
MPLAQFPVHFLPHLTPKLWTPETPTPPYRRQRLLVLLCPPALLHPPCKLLPPLGSGTDVKGDTAVMKVKRKTDKESQEGELRFVRENSEWKMILPL